MLCNLQSYTKVLTLRFNPVKKLFLVVYLANYFDYEAFGRELFMWDYSMGANGHAASDLIPLYIKGFSERKGSYDFI